MMTEVQKIFNEMLCENFRKYQVNNKTATVCVNNYGNEVLAIIEYPDHTSTRKFMFLDGGSLWVNIQYVSKPNRLVTAKNKLFTERTLEEVTLEEPNFIEFMNSIGSESLFSEEGVNLEKLLEVKKWLSETSQKLEVSVEDLLDLNFEI